MCIRDSFSYHASAQTGDLIQRATSDIDMVQRFLSNVLLELLRTIFLVGVGFFLMASLNVPLTVISFVLVPLIVADSLWFIKRIDRHVERFEVQESKVFTVIQENLTGARVVRAFGREKFELDKMTGENEKLRKEQISFNTELAHLWLSLDILSGLQIALVTIVGVIFAAQGRITVGQYTAFLSYVSIFLMPISNFGRVLGSVSRTQIAVGRIEEIMAAPEEDPVSDGLTPDLSGDISFDNVCFAYDKTPVLEDLNMTIHGGETVAILGGTGSGKSTLVQLLQRRYDPDSGSITIGGIDIRAMEKHHLRDRIGIVMQEPYLYSKTIGQNIGIKSAAVDQSAIRRAAKIACVHAHRCALDPG